MSILHENNIHFSVLDDHCIVIILSNIILIVSLLVYTKRDFIYLHGYLISVVKSH